MSWPGSARDVVAVRFGLLGDVFLSDPALVALRDRYPMARLRVLVDSPAFAAWLVQGAADKVVSLRLGVERATYRRIYDPRLWHGLLSLRALPPADVLVLLDHPASRHLRRVGRLAALALRARHKIGALDPRDSWLTAGPSPEELRGLHETVRTWRIAGGSGSAPRPRLPTPDSCARDSILEAKRRTVSRHVLAVQPVTRHSAKQWPLPKVRELLHRLISEHDALVVLVGSPAEAAIAEPLGVLGPRCLPAFGATLAKLTGVLAASDAFLGHDSAPFHAAVAARVPAMVLVGPGDSRYYRYQAPAVRVLRRCALDPGDDECPRYITCRDPACLPSLEVGEVVRELSSLLEGAPGRRADSST